MTPRSACYDWVVRELTSSLWLLELNLPDWDLTDRRVVRTRVDWSNLTIIPNYFYLVSAVLISANCSNSWNDGIVCPSVSRPEGLCQSEPATQRIPAPDQLYHASVICRGQSCRDLSFCEIWEFSHQQLQQYQHRHSTHKVQGAHPGQQRLGDFPEDFWCPWCNHTRAAELC